MKTINAKRIAAVAASLLMGLAFAGSGGVTWSNIPIINNQGQPVVQVVVGSTAQPSDGVVAANIAAVLGNLAFTSQNVTATPSGLGNVQCVVTTPTCTLSNQQVWFGVKGFTGPSGSYSFTALIGSVLNGGVQLGSPQSTKNVITSSAYTYPETASLQISPVASPFSTGGSVPINATPTQINSGGIRFNGFTNASRDNILQISSAQLPALANNWGSYGENEYLWLTGFPVFDQATGTSVAPGFAVLSAGGAYQVTFSKPIPEPYVKPGNSINNAAIQFLGKNWTILNYTEPSGTVSTTSTLHSGSKLSLAATLTPVQTVYVGHNISSDGFTVQLTDLGQPTSGAISAAAVQIYYNGTLTNTTQLNPLTTTKFTSGTHSIYVNINQTFAGLYAYQKWAKIKLYSNLVNITDSQPLNKTNANGWTAYILWTNGTSSGKANQLQSIVAVNQSPVNLRPGGSYNFISPNMTAWKVSFIGDTLGTNFDPVQFSLSSATSGGLPAYQNLGSNAGNLGYTVTNLTSQPGQILTLTSQIPNAFSYSGQVSSSVEYDLTPYALNLVQNAVKLNGGTLLNSVAVNVVITSTIGDANIVNYNNPITVTVKGFPTNTAGTAVPYPVQIDSLPLGTNTVTLPVQFYNITNIYLSRALPYISVNVVGSTSTAINPAANTMAQLVTLSPAYLYTLANQNYDQLTAIASNQVTYNQQNGQPAASSGFSLTVVNPAPPVLAKSNQYFTYNMVEYNVPGSTSSLDTLAFGIFNSTSAGAQNFQFQLNQSSTGTRNNVTYYSSQSTSGPVQAQTGFVTERGSKIASISPSSMTINFAKAVDTLQFVVASYSTSLGNASITKNVGPVGVGQAVPGYVNLTVAQVNATCGGVSVSSSSCSVGGLSNVTATPSVSQAVVPVSLNTATTPLVVLDSNANSAATLILIGSKFVNSVSAQVFAQNPALNSSFSQGSVIVQAYGTNRILVAGYSANQTVQAGNQFINDLLAASSTV